MVERIEDYKWTSYNSYIKKDTVINSTFTLDHFKDIQGFIEYMAEEREDKCLEYNPKKRYTDEELEETIALLVDKSILHTLDIEARDNWRK